MFLKIRALLRQTLVYLFKEHQYLVWFCLSMCQGISHLWGRFVFRRFGSRKVNAFCGLCSCCFEDWDTIIIKGHTIYCVGKTVTRFLWRYRSLTLVLAICEGSDISPKDKFSSYLTLYIVPHILKALGICENNFKDFLWKIYERKMKNPWKTCDHFVEFIGFMVCKTTGSISRSFLLKKIAKKCTVSRDICTSLFIFLHLFCKYLGIQCIFWQFFSARMTVRSSRSFCIP